ncbi:MAG: hypothetical protein ACYTFK_04130 [Planctomycetota bacterium]|jgi:hypothetical protein
MMKNKLLSLVVAIVLGLAAFVIPGCAGDRKDLVDSGVLSLENHAPGKVYIAWNDAYEDGDGFVITGVLRRLDQLGGPIRTHVDVTVLSPDGTVLDEARSSDMYVSRRITGRSYLSFKRFRVPLAEVPPKGSKVRVVTHSGSHK